MGYDTDSSKTFTESGIKRLYQYFIINILLIFISFIIFYISLGVLSSISSGSLDYNSQLTNIFALIVFINTLYFLVASFSIFLVFSGTIRMMLFACVLVSYFVGFVFSIFSFVIQIIFFVIILFLLIWGITYVFIGRKEFGETHKLFVLIGFCFAILYFFLTIVNIALAGTLANLAFSYNLFTGLELATQLMKLSVALSIILPIISNLAFLMFVYNLTEKKKFLWIAFILGVFSPFTFSITGIFSLLLYYVCYKDAYDNLETEKVKPKLQVPCPFCGREIPIESKHCVYCGRVFKENTDYKMMDF